ncbi:MAG TPA: hypothetical protein VGD26_00955 [Chitinophagaceae bacterium]
MANTVSLTTTVNTDDTATITDATTFSSPLRTAVGVFFQIYKVNYLSVKTEITATPNDADPELVASWTFPIADDGWYLGYYVSIPDYAGGTTYAQYDAVFDPATNNVYRSKQAGNVGQSLSNATWWEPITSPAQLAANQDTATESANIDSLLYNDIILNQVTEYRGDKAIESAQEGASATEEPTEASWHFAIADFHMEAALTAEIRQQYAAAERYIRRMDELVQA